MICETAQLRYYRHANANARPAAPAEDGVRHDAAHPAQAGRLCSGAGPGPGLAGTIARQIPADRDGTRSRVKITGCRRGHDRRRRPAVGTSVTFSCAGYDL
ncbi:MAG TPA: hypothetical protein VF070_48890 [Streptosporangiaceae bacterium]